MSYRMFWVWVLIAVLGGTIAGILLKWTPIVVASKGVVTAVKWVVGGVISSVSVPVWVLLLLLVAFLFLIRILLRLLPVPTDIPTAPDGFPNALENYTVDAVDGAIWQWRFNGYLNENAVEGLSAYCPRKDCHTDLEHRFPDPNYQCARCGYRTRSTAFDLYKHVRREIVSRARTGKWTDAQARVQALEQSAGSASGAGND